MKKDLGMYIHIPFCKSKCFYCDFLSFDNENKEELKKEYIECLKKEISLFIEEIKTTSDSSVKIKTIYIGGGTPSYIDSKYIVEIMKLIKEKYEIDQDSEITIEVNSGTVNKEKLEEYIKVGINRISIGLQSTHNTLLKSIGRIHTFDEFLETYYLAREVGFKNINVDLMLGLPNQSLEQLSLSIDEVIKLNLEHISVYSLILEEGTKLKELIDNKKCIIPDDTLEREMYWAVKEKLEKAGYIHYEISNFSKPNYTSKHNTDCWNQKDYIGFGLGAHSYTDGIRYSNIENLERYIENIKEEKYENNIIIHERQNKEDMMKEYMILGLRLLDGINIQKYTDKFNIEPRELFYKEIAKLKSKGYVEDNETNIKLTKEGLDFANVVFEEFI